MLLLLACSSPDILDVEVTEHPEVATLLEVSFALEGDEDTVQVEYAANGGEWMRTPAEAGTEGDHTITVLGVPADTAVDLRVVTTTDGKERTSAKVGAETGALPAEVPQPELVSWDPSLSSEEGWLLTSIGAGPTDYAPPFWIVVLDREAKVVWYHEVPELSAMWSRVSADGTHATWGEYDWIGSPTSFHRATLDLAYVAGVDTEVNHYAYDELPDGTVAFDQGSDTWGLRTIAPDGEVRDVWNCEDWLPKVLDTDLCGTNTVSWNEARGTYLWSFYDLDTVVEIDGASGTVIHSWGTYHQHAISPADAGFQLQHFPHWTAEGTLLVSTQEVGQSPRQWAREYEIDEETGTLEQVWSYGTEDHYAPCSGEAERLSGGNTLLNYGCEGTIREITSDGEVVWEVATNLLVGHQTLIADLYALNRGPGQQAP